MSAWFATSSWHCHAKFLGENLITCRTAAVATGMTWLLVMTGWDGTIGWRGWTGLSIWGASPTSRFRCCSCCSEHGQRSSHLCSIEYIDISIHLVQNSQRHLATPDSKALHEVCRNTLTASQLNCDIILQSMQASDSTICYVWYVSFGSCRWHRIFKLIDTWLEMSILSHCLYALFRAMKSLWKMGRQRVKSYREAEVKANIPWSRHKIARSAHLQLRQLLNINASCKKDLAESITWNLGMMIVTSCVLCNSWEEDQGCYNLHNKETRDWIRPLWIPLRLSDLTPTASPIVLDSCNKETKAYPDARREQQSILKQEENLNLSKGNLASSKGAVAFSICLCSKAVTFARVL